MTVRSIENRGYGTVGSAGLEGPESSRWLHGEESRVLSPDTQMTSCEAPVSFKRRRPTADEIPH